MEKIITSNNSDALNFFKTTERVFIMFSKIKQGFDRKSKRVVALMLAASMLCGIAGCSKETNGSPTESNDTSAVLSNNNDETGFDIERIRKTVVVDGEALEIPIKLKDLPKDWSWETSTRLCPEGICYVEVKDKNGDFLFSCGAENYKESNKGDSKTYDAPFENEKCSVDGITPFKSTREEIVERYGEPTNIRKLSGSRYEGWEEYRYGPLEGKTSNDWRGKCLLVTFNEKDIVDWVTIVYTD